MKTDMLPALLWILHAEDEDLKHIAPITRTDLFEGATTEFHDDGLFSTRIFGLVGSVERDEVFGKIEMGVRILHPKIYRDLIHLRELYKHILDGTKTAIFNEEVGDYEPSIADNAETGYSFFMRNLDKMKFKRNDSPARNSRIEFIEKWRHRMTMKNLVVMPAGLRDLEIDESTGRPVKHEINDNYYRVLTISRVITPSNDMNSPAYDSPRKSLQAAVYDIYNYIERIIGGKDGFLKDKWASRRVLDGTRNVLTSMPTSGYHLDAPNVPGFDSTVIGLYQGATAFAPVVIHWMRNGPLSKLLYAGEGDVPLVDPKTWGQKWVSLPPQERDRWSTEAGLRDVINNLIDIEARHRAVTIQGCYLALVYLGEGTFRIFDDISELPEGFSKDDVHPITLAELIYLSGYSKWANYFIDVVRYPIEGDDSTYPSRVYLKTTSVGEIRRELDSGWQPLEGDEFLAPEYPKPGLKNYHDSESPHPSRLSGLGADFDGDTGSATGIMINESLAENEKYLTTREAWVRPDGRPRASVVYDTSELVIRNLTGRFDHVKQAPVKSIINAIE